MSGWTLWLYDGLVSLQSDAKGCDRTTRHPDCGTSQRIRKWIAEAFG